MFNIDMKIPLRSPFKLDEDSLNKPSRFEILFIYKDIKYKYGFSCNDDKIIDEYLFIVPMEGNLRYLTGLKPKNLILQ